MLITKDNFDEVCKLEVECIVKYGWKSMFLHQPLSHHPELTRFERYVLQIENVKFLADNFKIVDGHGGLDDAKSKLVKMRCRKWCIDEIESLENAIIVFGIINL